MSTLKHITFARVFTMAFNNRKISLILNITDNGQVSLLGANVFSSNVILMESPT